MRAEDLKLSCKTVGEIRETVSQLKLTTDERTKLCGEIFLLLRNEQETLTVMMHANAGNEVDVVAGRIRHLKAVWEMLA